MQQFNIYSLRRALRIFLLSIGLGLFALPSLALDINSATAKELEQLKGVGPKRAQAIVQYRQQHGDFSSVKDLLKVRGIGERVLKLNAEILDPPGQSESLATTQ